MRNITTSIHIALMALTCLVALLCAFSANADCTQDAIMGIDLPPCKPAASAPCYIVGGHGEICSSEPAQRLAVDEWRPEYSCYAKYGICSRDDSGKCEWINNDEFEQCIADIQRGTKDSVIRCTTCTTLLTTDCTSNCK